MDLALGTVKENYDKDHPGMVRVTLAEFAGDSGETAWLPVAAPYAGKDYGFYALPEKDEQVVIGFIGGDPHRGVVLGSLWNGKNTLPKDTATDKNDVRSFITKGGHNVVFKDGDEGSLTVKTKAGHKIEIKEKDKKISVATSDGKQTFTLDENSGAITVKADKKVTLEATDIELKGKINAKGQTVKIESEGNLDITGKQIKIDGSAAKVNSQNTEVTGAMVKVESSGILTLKGSMAKIN